MFRKNSLHDKAQRADVLWIPNVCVYVCGGERGGGGGEVMAIFVTALAATDSSCVEARNRYIYPEQTAHQQLPKAKRKRL